MLLSGRNIIKEYGTQKVLDVDRLTIYDGDRIGLVGRNGIGKSTLLKILSGTLKADEGVIERGCEIAQIYQDSPYVNEYYYGADREESKYISRMNIRDSAIKSGGERTRLAIAKAFAEHAPLLFADEPTTNLDASGIEMLEKMLCNYRGAVVLISHDRVLLDKVCNCIWELDEGKLKIYQGNYSEWYTQRSREREFEQFEYEQYRNEKKRLDKRISQVKVDAKRMSKPPRKMSNSEWQLYKGIASQQQGHVQARVSAIESRLSHLEVKERPKELPNVSMKLTEQQNIKSKYAARTDGLSVSYDGKEVLLEVSIRVESGKKTFLTGENGAGKSTLIKALVGREDRTFITSEARVGYFSQDSDTLDLDKTVLENVTADAAVPEHICRAVLMNLYMNKQDMDKKISVLSGGERVKTALAKVLVSGCNFLVLDEPTNHMDIYTMEGLEQLLESYNGTALIISHDRRLVENLADTVLEMKHGKLL